MSLKQLPCKVRLLSLDRDGVGELETEHGERLRCGATSFVQRRTSSAWFPVLGDWYRLTEIKELPRLGMRASRIESLEESRDRDTGAFRAWPSTGLEDVLTWISEMGGEPIRRASSGATPSAIRAVEAQLGFLLPPSFRRFLERYHWIESRNVTTLGVFDDAPLTIVGQRHEVVRFIGETLAMPRLADEQSSRWGAALCSWAPLVIGGDPLPLGSALFADDAGRFHFAAVKEFVGCLGDPDGGNEGDFEDVLVKFLEDAYRDCIEEEWGIEEGAEA